MEYPAQYFRMWNAKATEDSVWSASNTDWVLTFLCEVPDGSKTKNQMDAITLLEHVRTTQQNWIAAGTREGQSIKPWLRHSVSNTITVRPDEWKDVANFIYRNQNWFAGISLLPQSGDKDFPQAPFTAVYTPLEIVREYGDGSLMASGLIVDGLRAFRGNLWAACDSALGIGESLYLSDEEKKLNNGALKKIVDAKYEKSEWVRRARQFAKRYCKIDKEDVVYIPSSDDLDIKQKAKEFKEAKLKQQLRRLTYLLKDVHNWKLWCDLKREYQDIDWSKAVEEEYQSNKDYGQAGEACAGGKCDAGELGLSIDESKRNNN